MLAVKAPVPGADLDEVERVRPLEQFPALLDLSRPQVAEDRMHLRRGLVVALTAPGAVGTAVVAVLGVSEGERHEAGKGDGSVRRLDLGADHWCERRLARGEREVIGGVGAGLGAVGHRSRLAVARG